MTHMQYRSSDKKFMKSLTTNAKLSKQSTNGQLAALCSNRIKGATGFADITNELRDVQRHFYETSHGKSVCDGVLPMREWDWLFNVTANDISVIYVTAYRCAGGLKKLDLRSDSQRHRHFVGFFNVSVQAPTQGHPFYTIIRETAQFSRLLRHDEDTEDTFST